MDASIHARLVELYNGLILVLGIPLSCICSAIEIDAVDGMPFPIVLWVVLFVIRLVLPGLPIRCALYELLR